MDISAFYNSAKELAEKIKTTKHGYFHEKSNTFCLIKAENGRIFSAISGLAASDGQIVGVASERIAANAMLAENIKKASELIVVSVDSLKVCTPEKATIDALIAADPENGNCMVAISDSEAVAASSVNYDAAPAESAPAPELGSPADFSDGFDFDETNPFFASPADKEQSEVPTIQNQPVYQQGNPQNGQPMYQQGYPQNGQPMYQQGYPQNGQPMYQQGYPQNSQPMYQQGFPQNGQPMYQQGYPQNGQPMQGFPQNGQPMQGFPQNGQPMQGFPQNGQPMQGYPQNGQPMQGYPQNGQPVQGFPQQAQPMQVQSMYQGQPMNMNAGGSVYTANQSEFVSQYMSDKPSAFRKRLGNMLSTDTDVEDTDDDVSDSGDAMSRDELMRQAKEKKKLAKMNSKFKG